MLKEGQVVRLQGSTDHSNDVLAKHGDLWTITGYTWCANQHHYFVESQNETVVSGGQWRETLYNVKDGRWIQESGGEFIIVEVLDDN